MKNFLFLVLLCLAGSAMAQSGYLGKRNFVELRMGVVPSYRHSNIVRDNQAIHRYKYGNNNYGISVSRVLARNFEMTLGYEFARMNGISDNTSFQQADTLLQPDGDPFTVYYEQSILDDPSFTYHGGQISFNFYRLGSLAPVGKYIGLTIGVGAVKIEEGAIALVGKRGIPADRGLLRVVTPIADLDTAYVGTPLTIRSTQIKARIGRNYPVSDRLMINVGMTFPLISTYSVNGFPYYSFELNKSIDLNENSSWDKYAMNTMRMYYRVTLEAGIRYTF